MRKFLVLGVVLSLALLLGMAAESWMLDARASSHREAPLLSQDPAADNTDIYLFRSPEDPSTVTLIANYYPYQVPAGGPNFYRFADDVRYELNIDNDGDAKPDIRYFIKFQTFLDKTDTFLYNTGPIDGLQSDTLTLRQIYTLWKKQNGQTRKLYSGYLAPPANVGCHSFAQNWTPGVIPAQPCPDTKGIPRYKAIAQTAVYTIPNGEGKIFAGQRRDSFFADVGAIFDLLSIRGSFSAGGFNLFDAFSVQTIALQIPIDKLTAGGDPVIGFWATNSRKSLHVFPGANNVDDARGKITSPDWRQVSRLGLALVNEAIIPMASKDKYNASKPQNDAANFAGPVLNPELAQRLREIYGLSVPSAPRQDVLDTLLLGIPGLNRPAGSPVPADMLRLNTATPLCASDCSNLGVIGGDNQGYPNGRRLTDDVVDISERVIAGVLVPGYDVSPNNALGDGVSSPFYSFDRTFPYLAPPSTDTAMGNENRIFCLQPRALVV